jgi:hypothetical protein
MNQDQAQADFVFLEARIHSPATCAPLRQEQTPGVASSHRFETLVILSPLRGGTMNKTQGKIDKRSDVSEHEGEREYGNVEYADPTNKKYPIDTAEHVRAAWSYINHKDNAAKYEPSEVKTIKSRIQRAAKKHGVEISDD